MRVEIENYRGWEISFDTDKEEFYCLSNEYDNDTNRKSFSASKKYIDDYIKLNKEFKPFFVTTTDNGDEKIKIVGVRKDGDYLYEDSKGKVSKLGVYEESNRMLVYPDNDAVWDDIKRLRQEIESFRLKLVEKKKELKIKTLRELKNENKAT